MKVVKKYKQIKKTWTQVRISNIYDGAFLRKRLVAKGS